MDKVLACHSGVNDEAMLGVILWGFACLVLASLLKRAESFFGDYSFHICGLHCDFCSIGFSQTVQVFRVR
ncbi:MAG: hypothetical protein ACJAY7_000145 [Pseudohongiellaceae bacterium]